MRLTVLGATGRTGRLVVERAIQSGHAVVGVARRPEVVEGATMLAGDIRDTEVLRRGVQGADAVISAVGARGRETDLHCVLAKTP